MTSMAVRGTIILLAAVALIGAVVALRIAQAQAPPARTYTISVTPDKVLEPASGVVAIDIRVEVTVSRAFTQTEIADPTVDKTVYWHIANDEDGDARCDFISNAKCANPAIASGNDRDFDESLAGSVTFVADTKTATGSSTTITPIQDMMIEGDEKIYLALCPEMTRGDCNTSNLLATASITIVGERVYVDNTDKVATTTDLTHPGGGSGHTTKVAGAFITGSDTNGYQMNNVKIEFGADTNNIPTGVTVGLHRDNSGRPGTPVSELCQLPDATCASSYDGNADGGDVIFTKDAGILLDPNAKYWVVVTGSAGLLSTTRDHGQTSAFGWSIQDGIIVDTSTAVNNVTVWREDTSRSLKMQVSGIPRGGVIVDTDLDTAGAQTALRVRENDSSTYSVRLDSPPPKQTRVEVVSDNRSIATAVKDATSTTTLTFTKVNWWEPQIVRVHGGFVNDDIGTIIRHRASGDSFKDPANLPRVNVTIQNHVVDIPLLDNIGNPASSVFSLKMSTNTIAQPFTVGPDEYSLNYIQVDFASSSSGVQVRVCAEDSPPKQEYPDSDCSQYTGPEDSVPAGLHTYSLASEKILSASKRYYVVICLGSGSVHLTNDTSEVRNLGWSLGDRHATGNDGNASPTLDNWPSGDGTAKVKLIGYQIPTGQAPTPTPSPTPTETPTLTPTATGSPTATPTITQTPTPTPTGSPTPTPTITPTATPTGSATATPTVTATPEAGPGVAPSGLRVAERTRSTATLSWIPGMDATGQVILATTRGDTKFDLNLRSDARSYTFTGLEPKVYTYFVVGIDTSGSYKAPSGSIYSASVTDNGPPVLDAKPKNLSVRRTGNTAILSWTPGTQAASHIVAAVIEGDSSATQVSPWLAADTDSYTFGGLKQGVYTYYVLARDRYGDYYFDSVAGSP